MIQSNRGGSEQSTTESDDELWDSFDDPREPNDLADVFNNEHSSDTDMSDNVSEESTDHFEETTELTEDFSDYVDDSLGSTRCGEEQSYGFLNGRNRPIYKDVVLTHNQSLVLLMSFVMKHQLTDEALSDFLKIMNLHLPNVVPKTKYLFYKKFNH